MGPNCVTEYRKITSLLILMCYLTGTLQRYMIGIDDPYASTVDYGGRLFLESLLMFKFENAPVKKINEILNKFKEVLRKVSNEGKIDMQRMQSIIDNRYLQYISDLENYPHETLIDLILNECDYGIKESDVSIKLYKLFT